MPMTLTVSRNRKTSHNYNSDGCGLSLTVELDQGLLRQPDELHAKIERLYAELDDALEAESERSTLAGLNRNRDRNLDNADNRPVPSRDRHGRREHRRPDNRDHNGHADEPGMTQSQRRAIAAIAKRLDVDPEDEATDMAGTSLDQLSLKQASTLIDRLKSRQHSHGNGSRVHGRSTVNGGTR